MTVREKIKLKEGNEIKMEGRGEIALILLSQKSQLLSLRRKYALQDILFRLFPLFPLATYFYLLNCSVLF